MLMLIALSRALLFLNVRARLDEFFFVLATVALSFVFGN